MVIRLSGDKVALIDSGLPAGRRRHPATLAEPPPRPYVEMVAVFG
jgi:hypothetical protein